ncbi:MAG: cation transporter, partial [Mailhella sp.]|nr:cation transporter [Mailhella sp.]
MPQACSPAGHFFCAARPFFLDLKAAPGFSMSLVASSMAPELPMEKTFVLNGLDCPHCAAEIERQAAALPGVRAASLDLVRRTLRVTAD